MVQRREADIGASGLVATPVSRSAIRYLQPMEDECLEVITRTPLSQKEKELFAIFLPFPAWLWITLGALTGLLATIAYFIEKIRKTRGADWVEQILWYFSAQLGLGAPEEMFGPHVGVMTRAVWMCWLWFTFLISTAYSTYLVSYLTVPKYEKVPTSLEEFIRSDYKLSRIQWGDSIDFLIKNSSDNLYEQLRKRLAWLPVNDGWDSWDNLRTLEDKFALIEQYSDAWTGVGNFAPVLYFSRFRESFLFY
jgi:hypothetical protein